MHCIKKSRDKQHVETSANNDENSSSSSDKSRLTFHFYCDRVKQTLLEAGEASGQAQKDFDSNEWGRNVN